MRTNEQDQALFATLDISPALTDMHYLLTRDYPAKAALALVGNRYQLVQRQQQALLGMSCSAQELTNRKQKELQPSQLKGHTLHLDGFNILIILETLLSGGYVFKGLDGCYRDISSVHGTYKQVDQTAAVLSLVGETLQSLGVQQVHWVFDSPVSNSGKLKGYCYEFAEQHHFPWEITLHQHPDQCLIDSKEWVCSSDAYVLNECTAWFNLGGYIIEQGNYTNIINSNS